MTSTALANRLPISDRSADRLGIVASALCAIHCIVTPPLLLLMPAFGSVWAHPATHWGMALVVVPLALLMITRGYRVHRRKWVLASAILGVALVLVGAALPYLEPKAPAATAEQGCASCCPSVQTDAAGETSLVIPPASGVTTLGGMFLVIAHVGNLCGCACCRHRKTTPAA